MIRADKVDLDGTGNADEGVAQEIDHLRGKLLAAIQAYAKEVAKKPIVYSAARISLLLRRHQRQRQAGRQGETKFPNQYKAWTPRLMKAAYNYQFVTKDPGAFAHNPAYTAQLLHDSIADLGTKVTVDLEKAQRP